MLGGFDSQQARFSYNKKLCIQLKQKLYPCFFDKNNYIDIKKNKFYYNRIIGFGLDNKLLYSTFSDYFKENSLIIRYFNVSFPCIDKMIEIFCNEIYNKRIVICNGIAEGFTNPRVFVFNIIGSTKKYRWKEASHNYALIGYDIKNRYFIVADNYGSFKRPYYPVFKKISFEQIYREIILIEKNTFDNSYSIGK